MKLTSNEKATIERLLKSHGLHLDGGSTEIDEKGNVVYHIGIRSYYGATNFGDEIGHKLKDALHADKIFFSGRQVA